jgi:hypothetical protein
LIVDKINDYGLDLGKLQCLAKDGGKFGVDDRQLGFGMVELKRDNSSVEPCIQGM